MAIDATYPLGGTGVYQDQGGLKLTVGTSGSIEVESGGEVNVQSGGVATVKSGGELNVDSGGAITIDDGGEIAVPVTVKSTSTGAITNYGVTTFGSTSADSYTLTAPDRAGLRKTLVCTVHGATTISSVVTTATTNSYIRDSTGVAGDTHALTFLSAGRSCELVSVSTSEWRVLWRSAADVSVS